MYLRRQPSGDNEPYRIDNILQTLADSGVKIYIIVYREPTIALTLDSQHTKQTLGRLHSSNISIIRHPFYVFPFLWSHHEKIVIIDQSFGFLGGLDICYGRYDTPEHTIVEPSNHEGIYEFPCINFFINPQT